MDNINHFKKKNGLKQKSYLAKINKQLVFDGTQFLDNTSFFKKDDFVLVEETLKDSPYQSTKKIYVSIENGKRNGPYILKQFSGDYALGSMYTKLYGNKCENLPRVYYVDSEYVIEEYISGTTLDALSFRNYKLADIISIYDDLCNAVMYLHSSYDEPIIHRDIKPSNVVIDKNNHAYLLDFGIARQYNKSDKNKQDTQKFGTVGFASPEQYGFSQTDVRSDIYSLGKVLQYLVSGIDASKLNNSNTYRLYKLNKIADKACNFDPKERYNSVKNLKKDIASAEEGKSISVDLKHKGSKLYRVLYRLGSIWNLILFICLLFMEYICFNEIFLNDSSSFSNSSVINKLISAFCVMFLVYIPIFYFLLYKTNIKCLKIKFPRLLGWFPILKWWQQIIFGIICFVVALVCGALSMVLT